MPSIKSLSLRGIKISDFSFLFQMNLDELALYWNSNSDLHELSKLEHLKEIALWRINKLSDISFIKDMLELEIQAKVYLSQQDPSHHSQKCPRGDVVF